jgi:putative ABC transport system permease protein
VLAILTLALGIGVNTAMFSVIRTVMVRPLPYGSPDRLVMIWNRSDRQAATWLSTHEVVSYQRDTEAFEGVDAYTEADADLTGGMDPERVRGAQVTHGLFDLLQVRPLAGRSFTAADAVAGNTS